MAGTGSSLMAHRWKAVDDAGVKRGDFALLLSASPAVRSWSGTLTALQDGGVAVSFDAPGGLYQGTRGTLIAGDDESRQAARVRCVAARDGLRVFALTEPWRDFVVRSTPRYPANEMPARLRSRRHPRAVQAAIVDFSLGGAAAWTEHAVAEEDVELSLDGDEGLWLPCRVVSANDHGNGETLHLAFGELTEPQRALVERLVAALAAESEAA